MFKKEHLNEANKSNRFEDIILLNSVVVVSMSLMSAILFSFRIGAIYFLDNPLLSVEGKNNMLNIINETMYYIYIMFDISIIIIVISNIVLIYCSLNIYFKDVMEKIGETNKLAYKLNAVSTEYLSSVTTEGKTELWKLYELKLPLYFFLLVFLLIVKFYTN